jgi:tetratricopeptide (TPR) repeat protein
MQNYSRLNNGLGWLAFLISAMVYTLTIEPTASFWDTGEFISSAYKMLVGHPPGAPFFKMVGRFFTLFAGDPSNVAVMVNFMSALSSAFTIAFLFWTITHMARKLFINGIANPEPWRVYAVMAAGFVGAMAFTFSDTFWFSAVEGEVYAMSSLFTAVVFWAILKWENVADEPHSNRWLILIAYLMGLSIGVHLLNLLAIPAIVMVYYFRKYEVTRNSTLKALGLSFLILGAILYGIIPGVIRLASRFELLFVNNWGLPFNSGIAFYAVLLIGGICYGIYYTYVKNKPVMNTILTGVAVILMGYSSFAMIVIRSTANPTMDQNSPEDVFSLMSYLNREQYGDRPLFSGQYYNSPLDWDAMDGDKGRPVYVKGDKKYEIIDYRPNYKFDERTTTLFPRMYSREARHIEEYKRWANIKGRPMTVNDDSGRSQNIQLPTFIENVRFFFNYQIRHMYFRYFMWNFAGRQNDIQGHGEIHKGNWISGIPFLDNLMYGDQDNLPDTFKNNPARNKYYLLPLLLGVLGLAFQSGSNVKGKRDFWVVMLLFFFTGLAIVLYLNQTPLQPRERDYAFAGSFYAFAIWIGLGMLPLINGLKKVLSGMPATLIASGAALILVPGIMAKENWDDHDRSHRTIARDIAYNYLSTVGENGIIFTNGDNDTFPLWYAQEVEGFRTDVRVANLSYLQTDWYIDQMKRKAYKSDPLPISMEHDEYVLGKRDVVYLLDRIEGYVDLKEAIRFLASDNDRTKKIPEYRGRIEHLPSTSFRIPADSAKIMEKGIVSEKYAHLVRPEMLIDLEKERILKNEVMVLDMLANNDWERPIYYAVTVGSENYVGLDNYFQLEGFGYQIVPVRAVSEDGQYGRVDTEIMYDNVMNKFIFDGWNDPRVYLDENHQRMGINMRNNLSRLATALIKEGDHKRALEVLDKTMEVLPADRIPHNYFSMFIAEAYYQAGDTEKADEIALGLAEENFQELNFFTNLKPSLRQSSMDNIQRSMAIYAEVLRVLRNNKRDEVINEVEARYEGLFKRLGFFEN